jgi:hypothetical protein
MLTTSCRKGEFFEGAIRDYFPAVFRCFPLCRIAFEGVCCGPPKPSEYLYDAAKFFSI